VSGFEAPQLEARVERISRIKTEPSFRSVEILAKPKPVYSEEGRRLRIEGEVWLEVLFRSDGTARVQRILRSLGYGLDENAERAAVQIRFRPAANGGSPIDQVATVRIQFQLAN
jgi:TonB family protein